VAAITVQMPYVVRANYDKQYLVAASSPVGTLKRDWINAGQEVVLEAPPVIDVVADQERLVFKRWDGMDGLLSPRISGKADRPLVVTAAYERQVMLKVNAPYGVTGDGWQKAGSVVSISVPSSVSQMVLFKASLLGIGGYPAGQSLLQVLLNEPTTLTALYRTEPELLVVLLLILLALAGGVFYLERRYGLVTSLRKRERREGRHVAIDYSTHLNGAHATHSIAGHHR